MLEGDEIGFLDDGDVWEAYISMSEVGSDDIDWMHVKYTWRGEEEDGDFECRDGYWEWNNEDDFDPEDFEDEIVPINWDEQTDCRIDDEMSTTLIEDGFLKNVTIHFRRNLDTKQERDLYMLVNTNYTSDIRARFNGDINMELFGARFFIDDPQNSVLAGATRLSIASLVTAPLILLAWSSM